ncbi:glycosyl transferase [Candidimonas nitroreducens]|uniref:Glycosyl transferase n=1 Tax=Candidimonas nitroreducens TaxID=683354 RepID=A0A225MB78_9BURK|nr:glycosyltransferase [Candidimonas nitroreducens]OWT58466.1 glycosyl transferase [Candidimonas nitroreducens]
MAHIISGLGQGGAETVLYRLVTAPTQSGRHVVVSMIGDGVFGPRLREAGIELHTLDMPAGRLTPGGLWRLYKLLRGLAPDVVQTWMYHADLIGGVAARLAGIRAVSWGIRNSGVNLQMGSGSARLVARICSWLSGPVPGVIVACARSAALQHQAWGYRAERLRVIPNGYDLSRWRPRPEARAALRKAWNAAPTDVLIGSVARWNPLKDHANLLQAFALSLRMRPGLRCVLVGAGMDEGNTELMGMLDRLAIRDRVLLLGQRTDVPQIMNALDVHVLSSRAEGFPNVVAEAMAVGLACVVTDVGDAAQIVGAEGWVAPPGDALALSGALNEALALLGTEAMAQRLERGRQRVHAEYGLDAMVAAYAALWRRLAADRPRRGAAPPRAQPQVLPRLLIAVNNPAFFLSHRLPIALGALRAGYEVHVATMDGPSVARIRELGLYHHVIPMTRSGANPLGELRTLWALWRLFRRLRPDLVHAVTIKPVLYGGMAARLARVPAFVAAISGLGYVFAAPPSRYDLLRGAACFMYRLALRHPNSRVIFQNDSDREMLARIGAIVPQQVLMIRGSGVDLDAFPAVPEPDGPPVAIMAARLLADKGVREFVQAARLSAGHVSGLRWQLVGSPDPGNPATITDAELQQWSREATVQCLGQRSDIAALYAAAHIVVLPSYREGLPKSLVEAAACGRAVVTTDVPGCRDAIEPDVTGLLVPVRDAAALAAAVQRLAGDDALRRRFGAAGRGLAEREFDVRHVVRAHLNAYDALLGRHTQPEQGAD